MKKIFNWIAVLTIFLIAVNMSASVKSESQNLINTNQNQNLTKANVQADNNSKYCNIIGMQLQNNLDQTANFQAGIQDCYAAIMQKEKYWNPLNSFMKVKVNVGKQIPKYHYQNRIFHSSQAYC